MFNARSDSYTMSYHDEWERMGFRDDLPGDATYFNQRPDYGDCYRGQWFTTDDERRVIYWGTFGNYNFPGASGYTYAEVYPDAETYAAAVAELEAFPEYLPTDDDDDTDPDGEDDGGEGEGENGEADTGDTESDHDDGGPMPERPAARS